MIKHVIFDIGNVLVKWSPIDAVKTVFPDAKNHRALSQFIFQSQEWFALNLGTLDEIGFIEAFTARADFTQSELQTLLVQIKQNLTRIEHGIEMVHWCRERQIPASIISDNTKEIFSFLKQKYDFWDHFEHIVISADLGVMKPEPAIFNFLLEKLKLSPQEVLFIDDHSPNVKGARDIGIHTIHCQAPHELPSIMKTFDFLVE